LRGKTKLREMENTPAEVKTKCGGFHLWQVENRQA